MVCFYQDLSSTTYKIIARLNDEEPLDESLLRGMGKGVNRIINNVSDNSTLSEEIVYFISKYDSHIEKGLRTNNDKNNINKTFAELYAEINYITAKSLFLAFGDGELCCSDPQIKWNFEYINGIVSCVYAHLDKNEVVKNIIGNSQHLKYITEFRETLEKRMDNYKEKST